MSPGREPFWLKYTDSSAAADFLLSHNTHIKADKKSALIYNPVGIQL